MEKIILQHGEKCSKNFVLDKKITSLDELMNVLNTSPSLFVRHRPYPSAFIRSWQFHMIKNWLDSGDFWTIKRSDGKILSWYEVQGEEYTEIISAYDEEDARKVYASQVSLSVEDIDGDTITRVDKLSDIVPEKRGEFWFDVTELLIRGIYKKAWWDYGCPTCSASVSASEPMRYDGTKNRIYCENCKILS